MYYNFENLSRKWTSLFCSRPPVQYLQCDDRSLILVIFVQNFGPPALQQHMRLIDALLRCAMLRCNAHAMTAYGAVARVRPHSPAWFLQYVGGSLVVVDFFHNLKPPAPQRRVRLVDGHLCRAAAQYPAQQPSLGWSCAFYLALLRGSSNMLEGASSLSTLSTTSSLLCLASACALSMRTFFGAAVQRPAQQPPLVRLCVFYLALLCGFSNTLEGALSSSTSSMTSSLLCLNNVYILLTRTFDTLRRNTPRNNRIWGGRACLTSLSCVVPPTRWREPCPCHICP